MSVDVTLPTLGESVREATISRWMKAVGDTVTRDEPLLEVSTDKVDTEIPAPVTGVLWEIRFNEDDVARVGDVLGVIGEAEEPTEPARKPTPKSAPAPAPKPTPTAAPKPTPTPRPAPEPRPEPTPEPEPEPVPRETATASQARDRVGTFDRLLALLSAPLTAPSAQFDMTPYMTASELNPEADDEDGVDAAFPADDDMEPTRLIVPPLAKAGSAEAPTIPVPALDEPHDTYVTPLVRKLAAELGVNLAQVHGSGVGGRIRKQDLLKMASRPLTKPGAVVNGADPRRGTSQPPSPARIARAELATNATLALAASIEVDVTRVRATTGSYMGAILQAVAAALRVMGELNASLLGDAVVFHNTESIGWVVDTTVGPLAPVIHDAGQLAPEKIEAAIEALVIRASAGTLNPADLAGGTFTVRDDGAAGLAWAMPAINRPQVAAMSIGCINRRAEVSDDGTVANRETVYLTLAFDRRVVDPGAAATFLQRVKATLGR